MKKWTIWLFFGICMCIFLAPISGFAVETSQRISDREIIESLTRLEEGIKANKEMIVALREEMGSLRKELRAEMGTLRNEILGF